MSVPEGEELPVAAFPLVPDRYRVESVIGSGATAVVYLGHDTWLQRHVAIKCVNPRLPEAAQLDLVLAEARTAAALSHPNICTVYEVLQTDGQPLIVMEYLDGLPLSRSIPPGAGLPIETVLSVGAQIADALTHAHDLGVVHRDFKSGNVMITPDRRAKVVDFGLSVQVAEATAETLTSTLSGEPSTQQITGTLPYVAPEVLRGEPVDPRADIWSLGVVLYEMAAGERPFVGKTTYELSSAILTGTPRPMPPGIPESLRAVILKCLTKEVSARYQSAAEVRSALEALQLELRLGRPLGKQVHRGTAFLLAAVVLLAAIAGSIAVARRMLRPSADATYVAVIPVVSEGSTVDAEALAEGVAESVIHSLWELPGLRMIAPETTFRYKRLSSDLLETVNRDLSAQFVVTIRVTGQDGQRFITAALVDASDRSLVWQNRFEAAPIDVPGIETRIAATIGGRLCERLSIRDCAVSLAREGSNRRPLTNPQAYQFYVLGRHYWYTPTSTAETYQKSLEHYKLSITADPEYAPAYLGIADTLISLGWEGWIRPDDMRERAEDALSRATVLDPTLGEAHYTRASLLLSRHDWEGAQREYEAGIRTAPSYIQNRRFYSLMLLSRGQSDQAVAALNEALLFDRRGIGTNLALGTTLYWARDLDRAVEQIKRTVALDPNSATSHEVLADVYESKGLKELAIAERQRSLELIPDVTAARSLGRDVTRSGYEAGMQRFYEQQLKQAAAISLDTYVSPMHFAMLHIRLGHVDEAFHWLARAFDENAPWLLYLRVDPAFDSIRRDSRFDELVRRVGIPSQ